MNRRSVVRIAHLIVAMFLAMPVAKAQAIIKPINPPTGGNTGAPQLIMVIADHYTAEQQKEFDYDVENFFKYGLMLDDYYKGQLSQLRILSYFEATPAGQASRYGFTIASDAGNCAVKDDQTNTPTNTAAALDATLTGVPAVPSRVHFVVLGNYPYDIGCTSGTWTYVAVDAVGTDVLQHEFGHRLGGLFDEWGMASNGGTNYPKSIPVGDIRNCSMQPLNWVTNVPSPTKPYENVKGCDLFNENVWHPYDMCRMGARHHREFCEVCTNAMDVIFRELTNAGAQPGPGDLRASHESTRPSRFGFVNASFVVERQPVTPQRRMARLLVEFDPDPLKPRLTVKRRSYVVGAYAPSHRRLGEYMYEVIDNTGTREFGILNDQLIQPRGYRGAAGHHTTGAPTTTDLMIVVADEDQKTFEDGTRGLQLLMYRIPPTVTFTTLNREQFQALKSKLQPLVTLSLQ